MEIIYDFLSQHKDVALATIDKDGNPAIRIFQIMMTDQQENKLYFATSTTKEVYRELKSNPNIEVLGFYENRSVRLKGQVAFDVSAEMSHKIYSENPVLPRLYKSFTDLVYFNLSVIKADFYDLKPDPPILESFNI